MRIYTTKQYHKKLRRQARSGPVVEIDGRKWQAACPTEIVSVDKMEIEGEPAIVVSFRPVDGRADFGVILDRQLAQEMLESCGPHPLVEEFFRLH